jgi:hypothetical protein
MQLDLPNLSDPKVNAASNQNGLDWWQRFLVKNLFDTQPEKRRAYLKQLGYEMGKDGETYRPAGSDAKFIDIEDEMGAPPKDYATPLSVFVDPAAWKDFAKDLGDVAFDTVVEGPLVSAGEILGTQAGAAVGTAATKNPIGAGAGGLAGSVAGSAAGKALAETIKAGFGKMVLEDNVPQDLQESTYQMLVTGLLGAAGKAGVNGIKSWAKLGAEKTQKMLKEVAVRKSNGTWNMELANDFAQNPEKYTPEAVKGATRKLLEFADNIFGTSAESPHTTRKLTGGVAREVIDPLNKRADLEIEKLSHMPEANFTVDEIVGALRDRVQNLQGKMWPTQDEEAALKFIGKELEDLKAKTLKPSLLLGPDGQGVPELAGADRYRELSFKEGRDFLKRIQNAAFENGPVKDNKTMASLSHGLKQLADAKAGAVGSDLPTINLKRSEILQTAQNMKAVIKDGTLQAAYTGRDSIAKERAQRMFEEADRVLGTNLAEGAKTHQFQAAVERVYESPAAFGSGSVIADGMRMGLKKASTGAFAAGSGASAAVGLMPMDFVTKAKIVAGASAAGGVTGFAKGFKEGASFASPDNLVKNFSKVKARIDVLSREPDIAEAIFKGSLNPTIILSSQLSNLAPSQPQVPLQAAINPEPGAGPTAGAGVDQAANGGGPVALPPELQDFQLQMPEDDQAK